MAQSWVSTGLSRSSTAVVTAVVLAAAAAVCGCTTHIADSVPVVAGGLPEHTPARPATPAEFPSVHERPEPRAQGLLTEDERKKLKDDLTATRERTTKSEPPANEQTAKKKLAGKKKAEPAATGSVSAAGAAPNP